MKKFINLILNIILIVASFLNSSSLIQASDTSTLRTGKIFGVTDNSIIPDDVIEASGLLLRLKSSTPLEIKTRKEIDDEKVSNTANLASRLMGMTDDDQRKAITESFRSETLLNVNHLAKLIDWPVGRIYRLKQSVETKPDAF